jgi:tetratricopeptide (TPR) repeat protein
MKKLAILLFMICCLSCKQPHSQKKTSPETINIEAIKLDNEASKLYIKVFAYQTEHIDEHERIRQGEKALTLLNRAIAIDTNYYTAYHDKLAFQHLLNLRDSAFATAKLIVRRWPGEVKTKILLGEYYELKGDTLSAFKCYNNALSAINHHLDEADSISRRYEQIDKAKILILLNQPEEAHNILKEVFDKEDNETIKQNLQRLMGESRHEFLSNGETPIAM